MTERRKHAAPFDAAALVMALAGGFIAAGLISILGFVTWALVYREIPGANANAFTLLIGILSTNVGTLVGFYFGASYANNRKEQATASTLETMAKTAQNAGPATPNGGITIPPGDAAKVTSTEAGTEIKPDP